MTTGACLGRLPSLEMEGLGLLDSAFSVFYSGFQIPLGIAIDAYVLPHDVLDGLDCG